MRFLVLISLAASLVDSKQGNLLRKVTIEQQDSKQSDFVTAPEEKKDAVDAERRQLSWKFVPLGLTFDDDTWYESADDNYVGTPGDGGDRLYDSDVCYFAGTYSRNNCPEPPNCDHGGKNGPAKLCIMRMPRYDGEGYHVLAMKCIPQYGDCERCMCGTTNGNGKCKQDIDFDDVDDSRISFKCRDLSRVKIKGHTFDATAAFVSEQPEEAPSVSPSKSPTEAPTVSPSNGPTVSPSISPAPSNAVLPTTQQFSTQDDIKAAILKEIKADIISSDYSRS